MGHGGGQVGNVVETGEYCLRRQWHIFGHGGGQEFVMDRIGEVGMFGRGGGRCPTVFLAGVCLPFSWCWFPFRVGCSLGQGGGRNREVE